MSYRSDLRDAEQAVIRAADAAVVKIEPAVIKAEKERTRYLVVSLTGTLLSDLIRSVSDLRDLRAQIDAPSVPSSDDDTSANAARMALPMVGGLRRRIVYEISRRERDPLPGATVDQLCRILMRKHQSVSSAVNFLRDAGWLSDSGGRLVTSSGRPAVMWVLTDFGRDQVIVLATMKGPA